MTTPEKTNPLNKQEGGGHYKNLKIQPIEYIHANNIPFAEGSVIKYVSHWRDKGGIQDLKKAIHFIELLIALESRQQPKEQINNAKLMPIDLLLDGMRVKLNFNKSGNMTSLQDMEHQLQGRWVCLIGAENEKHLEAINQQAISQNKNKTEL